MEGKGIGILGSFVVFGSSVFGYHKDQEVTYDDNLTSFKKTVKDYMDGLKKSKNGKAKEAEITIEEAIELGQTAVDTEKNANELYSNQKDEVIVKEKITGREDETMMKAQKHVELKPLDKVENAEREKGGEEREPRK